MEKAFRKTGIDIIADAPWGTHLCQFYETREDLVDILVPYFKAGLENNEFCMWITSEPLKVEDAKAALKKVVKNLDHFIKKGQIEILDYSEWYTKSGKFDAKNMLQSWVEKENQALKRGYDGLRLSGNTFWLAKKDWRNFTDYEEEINSVIGKYRMIAICTYSLAKCGASEVIDVVSNHQFSLIRREGKWVIIESSEQKRAEEEYRAILHATIDGFWIADMSGRFLEVNDSYCWMTGYCRDELLTMRIQDVEAVERPEETARRIQKIMEVGGDRFETRHRCKDGRIIDIEISVNYMEVGGGRMFVFLRDITEHKQAEEALHRTEENFHRSLDDSPLGVRIVTTEGETLYANWAMLNIYGYDSIEELRTTPVKERYTPESYAEFQIRMEKRRRGEYNPPEYEVSIVRKDGKVRHLQVFRKEILWNGERQFQTLYQDITEHKQAEKALGESEWRYRALFESINDAMFVHYVDEEGSPRGFIQVNDVACQRLGYTREELLGLTPRDITTPEEYKRLLAKREKLMSKGDIIVETIHVTRDGRQIPVESNVRIFNLFKKLAAISISRDITERKRAEEELRESEEKYRSVVQAASDAIISTDINGEIVFWNDAAERTFGYSAEEAIGNHFTIIMPEGMRDSIKNMFHQVASTGQLTVPAGMVIEGEGMRRDGSEFPAEISVSSWKTKEGTYFTAIMRDMSERKRVEEDQEKLRTQLVQAQKMEVIGHLAGGIAHDFNNVLAAIVGYASLMRMKMKNDDPLRSNVEQILSATERATALVRGLLAFSRKQTMDTKPIRMNEGVFNVLKLLVRLLGEDITIETIYTARDPVVMADAGQIDQVLINLATNARDAMPQGGHLIITTDVTAIDDTYVKERGYGNPGDYALITVSDTGAGMDRATQERIFEPFFTTKEVGKGTGLGLSTAYGILKQHGGFINCYSEPGKGTTFKIYLPLLQSGEKAEIEQVRKGAELTPRGSETILVAEDDETVRKLIVYILEQSGYTVYEAADGEEAIKVFMEHSESIDLLLLDVIMPKKNGRQAYSEIKKIMSGIKVLFLSGYTADIIEKRGLLQKDFLVMLKPVSMTTLLQKVRKALDRKK